MSSSPPTARSEIAVEHTQLFIGGRFRAAVKGRAFATLDPSTSCVIADVAQAGPEDVDAAVGAARGALAEWSITDEEDRATIIERVAAMLDERADTIGALEALDTGKPLRDAIDNVHSAAAAFRYWARLAQDLRTPVMPTGARSLNYALREPVGVVGVITPWNFPILLYAEHLPGALATGNTVVLKPAEQTPLTALALAALFAEAGLPDGALNVVPGFGPDAGGRLTDHPDVDMIIFTGSTAVGYEIAERGARTLKRVVLELGGKSPHIVFADADLEAAGAAALFSFAVNQGQLCTAGTRLLVEASIHEEFVASLVMAAEDLVVGDPFDADTELGALISAEQLHRVQGYVAQGIEQGARLTTGGTRPDLTGSLSDGSFYLPTIFVDVDPAMSIAQEEIFGPVLSVMAFDDDEHAVELANQTTYGLSASVWTTSLNRAHAMARAVRSGTVHLNTAHGAALAPHDRYGRSGIGVSGAREQLETMTRLKSVYVSFSEPTPSFR